MRASRTVRKFSLSSVLSRARTESSCRLFSSRNDEAWTRNLQSQLEEAKQAGTYKRERIITSPMESGISVQQNAGTEIQVLNFCANNYLGLSNHPKLVESAKRSLDTHGFGLSSVRFICGTQDIHKELEHKISAFHGMEDCILYASCFDANAGLFETLLTKEDAVISDALNHASIIDGIRLCKAQRKRYDHMDMKSLEKQLQDTQDCRHRMIATDGVFSMDGHIAPLREICDLADKYNAWVFIDDCHATGFFGENGRGTAEFCGVEGRVDIINSTLGKALGGATGGYTAASTTVVDMLRQKSRPYLFSNSLAPAIVTASLTCFDMITNDNSLVTKVQHNTQHFRKRMLEAGFTIGGSEHHPIVPVMLGDAKLASSMADEMLKEGIYVVGFSYPVVPKEQARIRVQLSAAHTLDQVDKCVDAFIKVNKLLA